MLMHFTDNTKTQNVNVCKEENMHLVAPHLSHGATPRHESVPHEPAEGHGGGVGETMVCHHVVFSLFCRVNFYQFTNVYFLVVCKAFFLYCLTNFYFLLVCIILFFPLVDIAFRQDTPHLVFLCTQEPLFPPHCAGHPLLSVVAGLTVSTASPLVAAPCDTNSTNRGGIGGGSQWVRVSREGEAVGDPPRVHPFIDQPKPCLESLRAQ